MLSLQNVADQVNEKNKSITNVMEKASSDNTEYQALFSKVDEAFALPEMENRLARFNQKLAAYNLYYDPTNTKDKALTACTSCVTVTGIIARLCENYGCVAERFVTNAKSIDCNSLLIEFVSLIEDDIDLSNLNDQDLSGTAADNSCITVPMLTISTFSRIPKKALCSCSGLDKILLATERLILKLAKAFDKAILYGRFDTGTSSYVALTNFDSINLLIPADQKLTATGEVNTYKAIIQAIVNIQDYTGCGIEDIEILIRQGVKTRMMGMLDGNDRLQASEFMAAGMDCDTLKIVCKEAIACQSLNQTRNTTTGVVTTDIFVGYKPHYVFGTYEFPAIDMRIDPLSQQFYRIGNMTAYAGKLLDTKSFYKITATF